MIPADAGAVLVPLARFAIEDRLGLTRGRAAPTASWLGEPGATFVTLTKHGELRGCIGSLEAWRGVGEDVASNARAAAFRDPRFPPVRADEVADLRVEVSLLSPATPLTFVDEADAVAQLRPGVDGVILSAAGRRGTFLPQVWEQLPEPGLFLAHLKRKAGLPASYWGPDVRLERYTVTKWTE
nr:AmmeMemoRadiSam system protein A [Propionibacterium sp.]